MVNSTQLNSSSLASPKSPTTASHCASFTSRWIILGWEWDHIAIKHYRYFCPIDFVAHRLINVRSKLFYKDLSFKSFYLRYKYYQYFIRPISFIFIFYTRMTILFFRALFSTLEMIYVYIIIFMNFIHCHMVLFYNINI